MTAPFRSRHDVPAVLGTYRGAELAQISAALRDEELDRRPRLRRPRFGAWRRPRLTALPAVRPTVQP
jgi:hypothetical protein